MPAASGSLCNNPRVSSSETLDYLDHHPPSRKTGQERFRCDGECVGPTLLDFWQWSVSDLVSNATRGILAEFIVASALGVATGVRKEWDAFDLRTPNGLKIEVKSCAYLQSWKQSKPSTITFSVRKSRGFDEQGRMTAAEPIRHSHLYIFALLHHRDSKKTLDPLNLDQWTFYPVPTSKLNERERSQHSITLRSLEKLCENRVKYIGLKQEVDRLEASIAPASPPLTSSFS